MTLRGARVCIATLDPKEVGGALTVCKNLYTILEGWGFRPSLLFAAGASDPTLHPRELVRRRRLWDVRENTLSGMSGTAIGHILMKWPWFQDVWLVPPVISSLNQFNMYVVVGGGVRRGVTFAVLKKRYICWFSTLFKEELEAKAKAGDPWAKRMLSNRLLSLPLWYEAHTLRNAACILAMSPHTARQVQNQLPETSNRINVVPNPIDTDCFSPGPIADKPDSKIDILFVGRLDDPRKNVQGLLKAFAQVAAADPRTRLILVGECRSPTLRQLSECLGIAQRVIFTGHVHDEELRRIYQASHIFVLPSFQEGLGIVVQEAMACGLPVVSTRCGGPEDYVVESSGGFLVDNSPDQMARAILKLVRDTDFRLRLGKNARDFAEHTFSYAIVSSQIRQAFEQVYPEIMPQL